jgi:dihydroxyacetone kinase-like predicted kinase
MKKNGVVLGPSADTADLFEFETIIPDEVDAICYGCKLKEDDRREIESIISKKLPNVSVFVAEKDTQKYGLVFNKV